MTLSMMRTYRCNVTSCCGVYSLVLLQVGRYRTLHEERNKKGEREEDSILMYRRHEQCGSPWW